MYSVYIYILNAMQYPGLDSGPEKDISGKPGEIQIKPVVQLIAFY